MVIHNIAFATIQTDIRRKKVLRVTARRFQNVHNPTFCNSQKGRIGLSRNVATPTRASANKHLKTGLLPTIIQRSSDNPRWFSYEISGSRTRLSSCQGHSVFNRWNDNVTLGWGRSGLDAGIPNHRRDNEVLRWSSCYPVKCEPA